MSKLAPSLATSSSSSARAPRASRTAPASAAAALLASHKASAARAAAWLKAHGNYLLRPTDGLELVAQVLGAANWQTLQGMAKRGEGPRADAPSPTRAPDETGQDLFERSFATGHAPTDKRNFAKRDGQYVEERIHALYEGFLVGQKHGFHTVVIGTSAKGKSLLPAAAPVQRTQVEPPKALPVSPPKRESVVNHVFIEGGPVEVENTREEVLYRGTVVKVDGNKVTVRLPAASDRPFIFDLDNPTIDVDGKAIFTAW